MQYPQLENVIDESSGEKGYKYKLRSGYDRLYGGKLTNNCIAEGTLVLTDSGWKPIEEVQLDDKVHDGDKFVTHGGVVYKSVQECVIVDGVYMTPDHEVLTDEGWKAALEKPRPYRPDIRGISRTQNIAQRREKNVLGVSLLKLWGRSGKSRVGCNPRSEEGGTPNCGCLSKTLTSLKNTKHGMTSHPVYHAWAAMKARCSNPNHKAWKNYGGRGIAVCPEWRESFQTFFADMGSSYQEGLSLERVNNEEGYHPVNCRWATSPEQNMNRRVSLKGVNIPELSRTSGISRSTLYYRVRAGVPTEQLTVPPCCGNTFTTSLMQETNKDL